MTSQQCFSILIDFKNIKEISFLGSSCFKGQCSKRSCVNRKFRNITTIAPETEVIKVSRFKFNNISIIAE